MKKTLLGIVLSFMTFSSFSAVIYVNANASGSNDGTSWSNAYSDLHEAISSAASFDTICVAAGTYYPQADMSGDTNPNDPREKQFRINAKTITLLGGYEGNETDLENRTHEANPVILSGNIGSTSDKTDNCYRVLVMNNADSSLIDGVAIEAIYTAANDPTSGDGLFITGSNGVKIHNAIIQNNETASNGGSSFSNSSIEFRDCVFRNNIADEGGAFYATYCDMKIYNTQFSFNQSATYGGAVTLNNIISNGKHVLSNCLFNNNQSLSTQYGGAAIHSYNISEPVLIINSTFANNYSRAGVGCSINSNIVDYDIHNSIFWTTNSNTHIHKVNSNSVITKSNCIEQGVDSYPQFADSANHDFKLVAGSAGIDAGDTAGISEHIPNKDLNGIDRFNGTIDLGPFELCSTPTDATTSVSGTTITANQSNAQYQWIDCSDNSPISGETNQSFTATQSGSYACEITHGCTTVTTNCEQITITGISDELENNSVSIYPNPTKDEVFISTDKTVKRAEIFSITGSRVFSIEGNVSRIDLQPLPEGAYILRLNFEGAVVTEKLIKK